MIPELGHFLLWLALLRESGVAEFDFVKSYGFFVWVILAPGSWRWRGRSAGGALVRVFARRDWPNFIVTFGLALASNSVDSSMCSI